MILASPVKHCLVLTPEDTLARVIETDDATARVSVRLIEENATRTFNAEKLRCGFSVGQEVEHHPLLPNRTGLGIGKIQSIRSIAGHEQVLVQFLHSGRTVWLPFQSLRIIMPAEARLDTSTVGTHTDHAERFRLKTLARALSNWDRNTGALGRLDIDPLPHQLHVAQKVVASGEGNWLIADDVGLGKTIEVGLILHALSQRNRCRRVLIVCPAGLVRQWQDELAYKFNQSFEVYTADLKDQPPIVLKSKEKLIVSLDLAKREEHADAILSAGDWDLVVFDEAHRLGRSETGERTQRYRLAEQLREMTPSMLLLTATPHQGKSKRFGALLELVRPDMRRQIASLEANPELVSEIVIRNRKTKVTDAQGELIFKGHDTQRFSVTPSAEMKRFDAELQAYLKKGYSLGARAGRTGRAVGFVMTTYRKLASSSLAAIIRALRLRRDRLSETSDASQNRAISIEDLLDSGDLEGNDNVSDMEELFSPRAFFDDEIEWLDRLIQHAHEAQLRDIKLATFLEKIIAPVLAQNRNVLVFTEYRATQKYLELALTSRFPEIGAIATINGSMSLSDKISNVRRFNSKEARVMVSTEAGGEGLNLQQSCHVMVNFDLPWNPSRLVQRIGRLYRYGQENRVQVLNLQSSDSFDGEALGLMMDRVATIARDMASVDSKNREVLEAEILGELLSHIDMEAILERATSLRIEQTEADLAEALKMAKSARTAEADILRYANEYEGGGTSSLTYEHLFQFVSDMLPRAGIEVRQLDLAQKHITAQLPDDWVGTLPGYGRRSVVNLSGDRSDRTNASDRIVLDLEDPLVKRLISITEDRRKFDGVFGCTQSQFEFDCLGVFQVRWQDSMGELLEDELIPITISDAGNVLQMHSKDFAELLLTPLASESFRDQPMVDLSASLFQFLDETIASRTSLKRLPSAVSLFTALRSNPQELSA